MDNIEESVIKARTYAFFMLALSVDKKNPDWADVKIPAGNFPKGFEHCEALTLGQIVDILQITVKKKLQDIVDELNGGGTVNPHPPIECANGASWFEFHTDLGSQIEWLVSANGGPWLSIVDHPAVEYWYNPQNFGATMVIVLREGLPPTPIQLKASSPVAFYVNPSANVNDTEQENQSYVLYNSQDVIVDPTLEINKVYNSPYINDTSTELDYCVMFNAVDFCLKYPEGPPVGCAGAIDTFKAIYMTAGGLYNFYVNDVEFTGTNWMFRDDIFKDHLATFGVILNAYDLDGNPVPKGENGRYDGAYMGELINTSNNYVRIKIFCGDASAIDNFQNPINPAANWDAENNTLTVCLAPKGEESADSHCFNFSSDDEFYLEHNGAFNYYINNAGMDDNGLSPSQFYISANGQPVTVFPNGGGATWGTDLDDNIYIGDADGYIRISNRQPTTTIVKICTRKPVPESQTPIFQPVLGSSSGAMAVARDADGYESCIIKLSGVY